MKYLFFIILVSFCANVFAQKETFNLTTYTPPENWKKDVTKTVTSYTIANKQTNSWCRINIVKSTISKGSIELDFESEWQELIVKNYNPSGTPQLNEIQEKDGWKIKTGAAKFTFSNNEVTAMLTTMSGFERCVSIVCTTNSQDYIKDIEAFMSSVELLKPEVVSQQTPAANEDENSIIGTWGIGTTIPYRIGTEGIAGTTITQYTFNANGTYSFYIRTFRYHYDKLLLTRETGTYQINGNNLSINPQNAVIEAWSKKDGTDNWGKLLSSQKKTLEKTTYQFVKHYSEGMKEWQVVLQAGKETKRDGSYNGGTAFSNAWIYSPVTCKECFIKLPD